MIRLGVISDSHHSEHWTSLFLNRANREGYDAVYFLGDGESEARWLSRRLTMPFQYVAGNCDLFSQTPRELLVKHGAHRLLAVHGHLFDVKWEMDTLSYYAEERGADIVLYGHTHNPKAEYVGPVLMLNPGALEDGCFAELWLDGNRATPKLLRLGE